MASPAIKDLQPALVVFLDVLGFGRRVKEIREDNDVASIYGALKLIHDEFEKNITNEEMTEDHALEGKSVVAFSDSIIISLLFNSKDSRMIGLFDNMLAHLYSIVLSQITCLSKGLFLRGGIAKGGWFREGDIMISDALVKAYEMESRKAKFPILTIDQQTYDFFARHHGRRNYAPDIDPVNALFSSTKNGQNTVYYLDYLRLGFESSADWYDESDRQAYLQAESSEQKSMILEESYKKSQLSFLKAHRQTILNAFANARDERARSKYRWLYDYHNSVAKEAGSYFESSLVDTKNGCNL